MYVVPVYLYFLNKKWVHGIPQKAFREGLYWGLTYKNDKE